MKSRLMIVMVSIVFAAVATAGAAYYIASLRSSVTEGQRLIEVAVAKKSIETGASMSEMLASGSVAMQKIPKQYVAEGALTSTDGYSDKVLSSDLVKGEQLTRAKFKKETEAGLAYKIPEGHIAVSIAVDEITGVGGKLQSGNRVDVLATFSPSSDKDMTKIMLQNVEILATPDATTGDKGGGFIKGGQQTSTGKRTVTLSVSSVNAEKLVFAAEKGHIWLGLRRSGDDKSDKSVMQTLETVFK
ncbi:Flp pilus assembly protein CpaB [Candidatus Aquicultor secundus]|nr:Flp pilus assembly protein CpaB [Candidatus Aquicultor secundus]NCO65677.1 Flp pilus assembly protein CpaB [Solirubrobacter sp.]